MPSAQRIGWLRGQPREEKHPPLLAAHVPFAQRMRLSCSQVERVAHREASAWQLPSELQRLGLATVQPLSRGQDPWSATHWPLVHLTGVL